MSSSYSREWTPDVYVSFIARDVEENFTLPLFERLERVGIGYYRKYDKKDDYLREAIRQARFAIVVFSANYAKCSHRLNELVNILRRGHSDYGSLVVIPIFHLIKPPEALELRKEGDVKQTLSTLTDDVKRVKENEWRRALAKVEGIPGYDLQEDADGNFSKLIDKIVERLVSEIWSLYSFKVFGPFGGRGEKSWHFDAKSLTDDKYKDFIKSVNSEVNRGNRSKVTLNKGEYVTSFSGHFQEAGDGSIRIDALRFVATDGRKMRVEPAGQGREDFSVQLPPGAAGKVIEFFGSKSEKGFVTSIGARVKLPSVELPPGVSCPVGLFGSRRGTKWDDKPHTTVKGIGAVCDSSGDRCIRSIAFLYKEVNEERWIGHGSDTKYNMKFIIDGPGEYLSSISGYCNYNGITSLTFLTNKKRTKTIGDGKGTHFSSPAMGYEIVGFYGWSEEKFLHGIGAYFKPILNLHLVKSMGPFGGGTAWDDGKFKGVKEISISYRDFIRYIKIVYVDDSEISRTIIHGDYTKISIDYEEKVKLTYPKEYLISISGSTRDDGSIQSLTFHSNEKTKTFGDPEGEYFGYPSNNSKIIGFYGTWGKTLNSIGVYVEPMLDRKTFECTPFKGHGGHEWKDGLHSNVVGFRVTHFKESEGSRKVESVTFMYENNGSLVEGSRHGGGDPSRGTWKMLNFPKERLLCIEGHTRIESGETIIHNLKISTTDNYRTGHTYANRGNPESFDKGEIKEFKIPDAQNKDRRIVGFFGRAGKDHLNSIGAHLAP